ncbi:hypothetical protein WOSG25_060190 [Weissella oryzae SG25]|uniref:Uncharacterized protein n=1 Tax=Weissella oryzae (strain DSM 25784 / JCM 18191 / LMG 30913 / SG25) TaxID=1329250 RepID=A0A069D0Q1_WEIOS|nr:hypothetical protein [Weissella oryzae]GAK30901.1 hypothetical protein WOSG25_060190 [Weissella oryzae SG25]
MVKFKGISLLFFSLALGLLSLSPSYANNLASVASAPVASTNLPEMAQPSENQDATIQNASLSTAEINPAISSASSSASQTSGDTTPISDPNEATSADSSSAEQASGNIAPIPDPADNASSSNQVATSESSTVNTTSATKQADNVIATTPSLASNSVGSGVQTAGIESVIASPDTTVTNPETQTNLLRTPSSTISGENQSAIIYKTENKRYVKAKNLAEMLPNSDIYHINWNPAMLLIAGLALSSWIVIMFVITYRQNRLEAQI